MSGLSPVPKGEGSFDFAQDGHPRVVFGASKPRPPAGLWERKRAAWGLTENGVNPLREQVSCPLIHPLFTLFNIQSGGSTSAILKHFGIVRENYKAGLVVLRR